MKLRISIKGIACLLAALAFPFAACADIVSTATLSAGSTFNFDTGTSGTSGGDLLWNGSTLTPQGNATAYGFPASELGTAAYTAANQTVLTLLAQSGVYTKAALSGVAVAPSWIIAVHTNGGNYAKLLVNTNSGGSISFQFTTYGATAGGGGGGGGGSGPTPTITAVENAATNILPGFPNAAIAEGALFVVKGANLGPAALAIATSFPLPASIGGTSIKVTVGGTTVSAIMYYSLAAQIAAILPSKTPVGTGTLTVTYNGQTSASAPITVVANNIGVFTLNSTGSGDAVATLPLAGNSVVSPSNAPNPGEIVTLWATGLGPVSGDETQPAAGGDMPSIPLQVFIAGQPATIAYRGRNACCSGVDTIYVTVPMGLTGCANSVSMQIGNVVSNSTTIPIGTNGRTCVPISPQTGVGTGTHSYGGFALEREVTSIPGNSAIPASTIKSDLIGGSFEKITYTSTTPQGSQIDVNSYGSCVVAVSASTQTGTTTPTSTIQWLDAGQVTVTGPGISGSQVVAKTALSGTLIYGVTLDKTATTFAAGPYTFTGAGGPDVGSFNVTYNMPTPFAWTNQSTLGTIVRANGATVAWSGGDPAGYVSITGYSTYFGATTATSGSAAFTCTARVSDGSFTVPPVVLLALPPSSAPSPAAGLQPGGIAVSAVSGTPATFQASGIDQGAISSFFIYGGSAIYQ